MARAVWKQDSVAAVICRLVEKRVVVDPFMGPGGLASSLCSFSSGYSGCETSAEMRGIFFRVQTSHPPARKVRTYPIDGYKFARLGSFDVAILDPPWGGYQVFLGERYVLERRNRKVVELALHILRSGKDVVFVLPFHTVLPPRLDRWKFFESDVIKKYGRDYCKVWAFRR